MNNQPIGGAFTIMIAGIESNPLRPDATNEEVNREAYWCARLAGMQRELSEVRGRVRRLTGLLIVAVTALVCFALTR